MKVILDGSCTDEDIEVEEFLEPTGPCYGISQDGQKIFFGEYMLSELIRTLKFMERND